MNCTICNLPTGNIVGSTLPQCKCGWQKPNPPVTQRETWTPVEIAVDVTKEGTHVIGMYVLMPEVVRYVFYSQFHPAPQRTWVGLTDEEIDEWTPEIHVVIRAIEAKLKEKNA